MSKCCCQEHGGTSEFCQLCEVHSQTKADPVMFHLHSLLRRTEDQVRKLRREQERAENQRIRDFCLDEYGCYTGMR